MATAFQIGAFQGDSFQVTPDAFVQPPYWTMVTTRPVVQEAAAMGFSYAFPLTLGGTEALRTLRTVATLGQAAPVTGSAVGRGFSYTFPLTLGGTEALRTLRNTSTASFTTKRTASLTPKMVPRM